MQTYMIPPGGPVPAPTGFTLADSARDFGGDPRAQAYATWYEVPAQHYYHQYIYHTGVAVGTYGLAKGVATSHWDGTSPEIAIVNHALHSVVIAGVWADSNPAAVGNTTIDSFAVYNPWDQQNFGTYLNGAYYARVSYSDWTTNVWWWGQPYNANIQSNGVALDPDPVIGIYQAGPGTSNPNAHYWIGNYVSIQRDEDAVDSGLGRCKVRGELLGGQVAMILGRMFVILRFGERLKSGRGRQLQADGQVQPLLPVRGADGGYAPAARGSDDREWGFVPRSCAGLSHP